MEKQIKPHRNLFAPTIAQKNKHLTTTALLPKAKYYRTYLEPYLNDVVYIECARWYIKPDFVDGRPGDRILLLDAILVSAKHHEIQHHIPISHIWTVVDSEWKHRVHVNSAGKLYLKGFCIFTGTRALRILDFRRCMQRRYVVKTRGERNDKIIPLSSLDFSFCFLTFLSMFIQPVVFSLFSLLFSLFFFCCSAAAPAIADTSNAAIKSDTRARASS